MGDTEFAHTTCRNDVHAVWFRGRHDWAVDGRGSIGRISRVGYIRVGR